MQVILLMKVIFSHTDFLSNNLYKRRPIPIIMDIIPVPRRKSAPLACRILSMPPIVVTATETIISYIPAFRFMINDFKRYNYKQLL